jgi:DNA-binding HxlR family transcriptional regulator
MIATVLAESPANEWGGRRVVPHNGAPCDVAIDTILAYRYELGVFMDPDRIYRHFCMEARALEVVGDRWSLLIVRDLLLGPRRFTDLARGLNEITPTRLTGRLRQLEAAGIIVRDPSQPGREVWYGLTDAGRALEPVIDALTLWGIENAREGPLAEEPVGPEPVMIGTKVLLNRDATEVADGLTWAWRFPDEEDFTLRFDSDEWRLSRGREDGASVAVVGTPRAWATFITTPRQRRRLPGKDIRLEGSGAELKRFAKAFAAKLAPK